MQWVFILVFVRLLASSYGLERGDLEKYGPFQLALNSKLIKCDHDRSLNLDVSAINVFFYDFQKPDEKKFPIKEAAKGILSYKNLNHKKRFFFFVGGFKSNINKNTEEQIRNTFQTFPDSYLIMFDHSAYTNDRQGAIKSYERSVKYVHYIGKAIADFLTGLSQGGISPKNMHCIGHSLGSQMLGHAGAIFFKNTRQKIWRITGLDPAGPCFHNYPPGEQIRSGVAEYVEVYHCNAGSLGTRSVLADIDFYANKKGEMQPNCNAPLIPGLFDSAKAAKCSHKFCVNFWAASVAKKNLHEAKKCNSYKEFKNGKCAKNEATTAGFWNPGKATGVFYFSTD